MERTESAPAILRPGDNCWRVEKADRVAFVVDGAAFFAAFRSAALKARRSLLILGWDVDSRLDLLRAPPRDGRPSRLKPFLDRLARDNPDLHIHVLIWQPAFVYFFEREWLPRLKLGAATHPRVHFHLTGHHPPRASLHQKVIVVDDKVAFSGGLDLAGSRWDVPEHDPADRRRVNAGDKPYRPFHDVQMLVAGDAAHALGELVRDRWKRSLGEELSPPPAPPEVPWPDGVATDLHDVEVAIARTEPPFDGRPGVREVERLWLDSISAARENIYIENQFLTSERVADALARRLEEAEGPDVVVLVRRRAGNWAERRTMDRIEAQTALRLKAADRFGRLRILYPRVEAKDEVVLDLHSKVAVIDDRFVRVGSANLTNRSMGVDTECDLAIDAPDRADRIAAFRDRLLGEHLGAPAAEVARAMAEYGRLTAVADRLGGGPRGVAPYPAEPPEDGELPIPAREIVDPEVPLDGEGLFDAIVPEERVMPLWRRIAWFTAAALALVGIFAAWRLTPLREWLNPGRVAELLEEIRRSPLAAAGVFGAVVAAAALGFPITVLVVACGVVFPSRLGFGIALSAALTVAVIGFLVGRALGERAVRRFAGERVGRVLEAIRRRGVTTMALVRLVPAAPYQVVNLMAGAFRIRFRDYFLGTLIGMGPGIAVIVFFVARVRDAFADPGPLTVALPAAIVLLAVAAGLFLRKKIARRRPGEKESG